MSKMVGEVEQTPFGKMILPGSTWDLRLTSLKKAQANTG
jgi:hypothetical protein